MWNTVSENPQVKEDIRVELRVHLETEDDVMMMLSRKKQKPKTTKQTQYEHNASQASGVSLLPPGGTRKEVSEAQSLPSFPLEKVPNSKSTLAALIIRSFFTSPGIPAPSPPPYRRGREGLLVLCDCLVPLERSFIQVRRWKTFYLSPRTAPDKHIYTLSD